MRPGSRPRAVPVPRLLLGLLLLPGLLPAQDAPPAKEDDEVQKLAPVDPYTGGDAERMALAGVVAYGPFPWADFHRTEDVDRVLGERRTLWLETAHFRIGSSLKSAAWPEDADARKGLQEEIKRLRKKLPKVPEKPRRLDPWLRLHLYAQRCEQAYAEFQALVGQSDADFAGAGQGAFLGMQDKFLLLLSQKRSDMARYMDRFCDLKEDRSMRYCHPKTRQMLLAVAAEGLEGFDESGLHGHVVYALWHNLMSGYLGFSYSLPHWFAEGIAHWHGRKVPSRFLNIQIRDDEAVAEERQDDWPVKVRRRAQHEGAFFRFEQMVAWEQWSELGYHAHSQSWSRLDYLLQLDRARVGTMLRRLKSLPATGGDQAKAARELAVQLLQELFGLDGPGFDRKWREWVLKTYPKK